MGYQLLVTALVFALVAAGGIGVYFWLRDEYLAYNISYLLLWVVLILMMAGPANRSNANDNTSGVVTLLEMAKTMPQAHRGKVCFVLFDLEEMGLIGSASYRSMHKSATNRQIVLNLDCVGDGDEIMMFPGKKLRKRQKNMESLRGICRTCGEKNLSIREKGFSVYPSDQSNFPYGVGIAAFHRTKGGLLYLSRIHTNRDTVLERSNVNILRAALTTLITGDNDIEEEIK